jgi:hypothetical protein
MVKYVRCDNAGENRSLQKRANSADWKLNIKFEFTPRDTPQHNHLAELGLASVSNKGRSLLSAANVPMGIRYKVWVKAFQHATNLDGLAVIVIAGKTATRYEHWYGRMPKWVKHLRTWGESGTVKIKSDTTPKIADRGIQCMFVGHSADHDGDCYEMWYPKTNRVYTTRDVIWLNCMYYTVGVEEGVETTHGLDVDIDVNEADVQADTENNNDDQKEQDEQDTKVADKGLEESGPEELARGTTRSGVHFRDIAAANLERFPIELTNAEKNYFEYMKSFKEIACVGAGLGGGFANSTELHVMKYEQALNSPDEKEWRAAIEEEYNRMEENEVWTPVPKSEVPPDAKVLTSTWAMKKKADGTYRARLNGRGFEQVPGVHYDPKSIAAPVVALTTVRIVFIIMLMAEWHGHVIDVRGAFLKGDFGNGELLYLQVPKGMERWYGEDVFLLLRKTLYGLKQAAYRFWIYLLAVVRKLNFKRSKADPCLYFRWTDEDALLLWFSWVDDCFITGPETELLEFKKDMMQKLDCEDGGELKEFVGCKIDYDRKHKSLKFTQPVLQSFADEFAIAGSEMPKTPGVPLKSLQLGSKSPVASKRNTYYRSGTGKLMHLRRWSRPEMANALRDLSRYNTNCSEDHIDAMHRAMRYAYTTPHRGLQLTPVGHWDGDPSYEFEIEGYADASYKPYHDIALSVGGHAVFLQGAPITEKSKVQQSTTLSLTEAELTSGTECAQDMLFGMRLLESIGLKVKKPMKLTIDNKGAVDYANNWSNGGRMRHTSIKLSFLRELKEEGLIDVSWCESKNMPADLFTKNLGGPQFKKHTTVFCGEDDYG